jgi:hypothetical protein
LTRLQSRRIGLEASEGRHCWSHGSHQQRRFQSQGP